MFKWTGSSGRRDAGGGGVSQTGRVTGMTQMRQAPTEVNRRRRPAFLPDEPEQQAWDSNSSRLSGLESH